MAVRWNKPLKDMNKDWWKDSDVYVHGVLVRVLQRDKCLDRETEIYFKKLAHNCEGLVSPTSDGGGQQAGHSSKNYSLSSKAVGCRTRKSWCCRWSPKAVCWQNSLLLRRGQPFVLFRPLTDWMRPTHSVGNVLYSKPIDLNVNLIQKHLHKNIQKSVWAHLGTMAQPLPVTGGIHSRQMIGKALWAGDI